MASKLLEILHLYSLPLCASLYIPEFFLFCLAVKLAQRLQSCRLSFHIDIVDLIESREYFCTAFWNPLLTRRQVVMGKCNKEALCFYWYYLEKACCALRDISYMEELFVCFNITELIKDLFSKGFGWAWLLDPIQKHAVQWWRNDRGCLLDAWILHHWRFSKWAAIFSGIISRFLQRQGLH